MESGDFAAHMGGNRGDTTKMNNAVSNWAVIKLQLKVIFEDRMKTNL